MVRDASDHEVLLAKQGIDRAHVVGLSFSGAITLQLSTVAPDRVHTLTLIEPPPVHTPSTSEFRAANDRLLRIRRQRGLGVALDELLAIVFGPDWQQSVETLLLGSSAQRRRDVASFFDNDLHTLFT